jgi:single-strand DNA-binding protein
MLRVTLLGNLGGDPELRYTAKGAQMVVFNVAVNQIRKGQDGERQENTEWFRIQVTGPKADYASRFQKGNRVMVIGRLNISHYQAKTGEARTGYDVWADEVEGMGPRPRDPEALMDGDPEAAEPARAGVSSLSGAETPRPAATSGARARPANGRGQSGAGGEDLEDLPF